MNTPIITHQTSTAICQFWLETLRIREHQGAVRRRTATLKEEVPPSDPPLVECLEALHCVVVGVFGQIADPETKAHVSTFEETFMGAMRTQSPRMILKVRMLIHNVPAYVRRTAAPLGLTSEQALESQHRFFNIFFHRFKVNCTNSPVFRERLLNAVLHYNACYI